MTIQRPLTVEEICNKLRPVFGKKIDDVYFQYTIADTKEEREEIAHLLNTLYQKNLNLLLDKGVLLEPPRKELIDGDYNLATVSYAKRKLFPFTLRERDWPRHVCITGMSGSGKTTLAINIAEQFIKHYKPFLIFDWKKSFRPLLYSNTNILHFTVGDEKVSNLFKSNINKPPKGVAPKEWINVLVDLLTESFFASFGVHKVLLETLDEAFKEWGIYQGSENYPTWNHIKWRLEEKMNKTQGREAGWIESAMRIATILTFGDFGKTMNYKGKNSVDIEDILDQKVILELNSLGNIEKKFFCEYVLTYIYKLKKARQSDQNYKFDHAIIVDEAHNIFLKKPTTFSNESVTDMIYREMREYGTSLICLDQHISKISDTVKGNSACNIAFQQQLPQDIEDVSKLMQLWEKRHYFSQLPVGSAIVKLSERYNEPFYIEVPYSETRNKNVSDEEIRDRMKSLVLNQEYKKGIDPEFNKAIKYPTPSGNQSNMGEDSYELNDIQKVIYNFVIDNLNKGIELGEIESILEDGKDQGNYTSSDIMRVINKVFSNHLKITFKNPESMGNLELTNDERKFVEFLRKNPTHNLSTVEVYRQIGLSPRKGTKIKNLLQEKGLIKIEEIKYDKGWKKLIRIS